jgi:CspA family cold shock protein
MSTEIFIGRVKWFNNKTGYGFITVTDGKRSGNDIFVHHSAINVEGQYKYLVQGEYVEFTIVDTPSGKHDCQAGSVNGIKGGKLMCTTRHETNIARSIYRKENKSATGTTTDNAAEKKTYARSVAPKREGTAETTTTVNAATPKPKQAKPARTKTPVAEEQGEWVKVVPKGAKADAKPRKPRAKKQAEEAK